MEGRLDGRRVRHVEVQIREESDMLGFTMGIKLRSAAEPQHFFDAVPTKITR
jgi:hypothetical protein